MTFAARTIGSTGTGQNTTTGTFTSTSGTYAGGFLYGKGYGAGFGSAMSPTTLLDSKTITMIFENQGAGPFYATTVEVNGFSSDPTINYFYSITVNGITKLSSFFTYTYTPGTGTAQWFYSTSTTAGDVFNMPTSGTVNWTLTNYG